MTKSSPYADIANRFANETASHEMTVLHDAGLYRHLRFKAPDHGGYWFDLVTWPGTLAVRGDIDGFMFTRDKDMFEFFRMHRTSQDGRLEINPHYWSEKVEGGRDITKRYSEALFRQHVIEDFKDAVKYGDAPRGLGKAIRTEVLESPEVTYEDGAHQLLRDFRYGELYLARCLDCDAKSSRHESQAAAGGWEASHRRSQPKHLTHSFTEPAFTFSDAWEWDLRDYDWSFLWGCHAIVWGIRRYDAVRATSESKAVVLP